MDWIGPKARDVPPHPRREPRYPGALSGAGIRTVFEGCADFQEREVLIGGDPEKKCAAFGIAGQVRTERLNDYVLRPLATSELLRDAPPEAALRMLLEGIVYSQNVTLCTTLDQAVFAQIGRAHV